MADSLASRSDVKEKAFRYLFASVGFFATPRWFVLMVVIQRFVAVLWYTVAARSVRGRMSAPMAPCLGICLDFFFLT